VADLEDRVHRRGREAVRVRRERRVAEREPRRARGQVLAQVGGAARQRGCGGEAAVADHFGRHALPDLAFRFWIQRQREVGVRVDVDEARREREPGGVDEAAGLAQVGADRGDRAVRDRDVDASRGRTGAVEHLGAPNQEVVHGYVCARPRRSARPASAPVCLPESTTTRPFTTT
jgi:hypothetical protein